MFSFNVLPTTDSSFHVHPRHWPHQGGCQWKRCFWNTYAFLWERIGIRSTKVLPSGNCPTARSCFQQGQTQCCEGVLKTLTVALAVLKIRCCLLSNIYLTFLEALTKPGLPYLFLPISAVCFHWLLHPRLHAQHCPSHQTQRQIIQLF